MYFIPTDGTRKTLTLRDVKRELGVYLVEVSLLLSVISVLRVSGAGRIGNRQNRKHMRPGDGIIQALLRYR